MVYSWFMVLNHFMIHASNMVHYMVMDYSSDLALTTPVAHLAIEVLISPMDYSMFVVLTGRMDRRCTFGAPLAIGSP